MGDKVQGVRWGAVKARLNEERAKSGKTAEGLETSAIASHLVGVYILKIIFHTPTLTCKGKWASEKI